MLRALSNKLLWQNTIFESIEYLLSLKDSNGVQNTTFQYCPTFKFCQDHLELLFLCIRGKNVRCFKSALKYILLRGGNCFRFENDAVSPIFSLVSRHKDSCSEIKEEDNEITADTIGNLDYSKLSFYKEAILAYIGGFVVQKLQK